MTSAALAALILAQAASPQDTLVIESDSSCPSKEAVFEALAGLKPLEDWPSATISIATQEQSLLLSLGSRATNQRRLVVDPDCGARAATVALVIATWLSELPAEAVVAPVVGAPPSIVRAETARPTPDMTQPKDRREAGAGLVTQMGSGLSPGLRVELLGLLGDGMWGWQASLVLPAARDLTVGPGRTSFRRTSTTVSLLGRFVARRLVLSADGGASVAYTRASGRDYQENQSDESVTYGIVAGVRAGMAWGRIRLWTDGRLFKWLYGQTVAVEGVASTVALPSWDLQWTIGASFAF